MVYRYNKLYDICKEFVFLCDFCKECDSRKGMYEFEEVIEEEINDLVKEMRLELTNLQDE